MTGLTGWTQAANRLESWILVAAAAAACVSPSSATPRPTETPDGSNPYPRFPQEARGEIHFSADGAILVTPTGDREVFLYIGVPEQDVVSVPMTGRGGSWMEIGARLSFLDSEGAETLRLSSALEIPSSSQSGDAAFRRRVVRLRAPLEPDVSGFELELRDQNAVRPGLLHQLRSDHTNGVARGSLKSPTLQSGTGLGGPLFLWGWEDNELYRAGAGLNLDG